MSATAGFAEPFLERSRELSLLGQWLREADGGAGGRFALVAGEAGVGKTTLLRRASEDVPEGTRIIWGACDSLFTPQPLGPLLDVAEQTGGELAELVQAGGTPHPVATALLHELAGRRATLLVIEDLHWADESSLDVLRIVARRIASVPLLLLASYRDEE